MRISFFSRFIRLALAATLVSTMLSGCGYNAFQTKDEATKAAWGEVVNQYQRRADLIPNLVNTVKGYASHERETLESVTRARAAATSFQITPEVLNDPEAFKKFQAVQGELSGALSRLMVVSEKYPDLKGEIDFLADFSKGGNLNTLDFAGRLTVNEHGEALYNFGKHKGKTVKQVNTEEPGYYGWFVSDSTDFPKYTKQKLKEEMDKIKAQIKTEREEQKAAQEQQQESLEDKLNALKQKFGNK